MHIHTECSFAITPRLTLDLFMVDGNSAATKGRHRTNATVTYMNTSQLVNSSFCHIASLEVYRGREQVIKINHGGFSLSDNGTIEV